MTGMIIRGVLLALSIALLAAAAPPGGAPRAATIKTETIAYEHDGKAYEGYLAYDESIKGPRPAVLICHEWWGNNEYSRRRARDLAALGYTAFALDMYGQGRTTSDPAKAQEWSGALYKDPKSLRELATAGLEILRKRPETDPSRIAVIGYCMGGSVALELARTGADVDAVVCFHTSGLAAANAADNANIKGRVLVCTGADDPLVPADQIAAFKSQMADAKIAARVVEYPGAKHSFTNPDADKANMAPVAYNQQADEKSWADMRALFAETIDRK
ncbi:MAG: dienelactone hydrolase family protein [Phycisphaeraceae bacterium]|nr:dienelactone hydrolase family protein [Phycisphaeraceae bacterium]